MRTDLRLLIVCTFALLIPSASAQLAETRPPDWVAAWIRACHDVPGCAIVWRTGVPLTDAGGSPVGVMNFRHSMLYRWPDCLRRDEEYLGGGPETTGSQRHGMAMLYERSVVITPDAQRWTLSANRPQAPELGVPLDSHYVLARELPSAPWLLGRWMADHPGSFVLESMPDQAVRITVPAMRLRAVLFMDGGSAVIRSIEEFQNGNVVLEYRFAEFRTIPGWPVPLAHTRTLAAPSAGGELVALHTDALESARLERAIPDTEFTPERTRMADRLPGLLAQSQRLTPTVPLEPAPAGIMIRENAGSSIPSVSRLWPWAVAMVGVGGIVMVTWRIVRRRSPA